MTWRSIIWGFILSIVLCAINSFLTLKVGVIEEGAIVSMAIFVAFNTLLKKTLGGHIKFLGRTISIEEVVIVATMGSCGGAFGFIANFFAAFKMIGHPLTMTQMIVLPLLTSFSGLMMAIPIRQLYVVDDSLPWPTSKAAKVTAEVITSSENHKQSIYLLLFTIIAGGYIFLSAGKHIWPEEIPLVAFGLSNYGMAIACSPFVIGAGYLIGLRAGNGFLLGAIILTVIAPYLPIDLKANYQLHPWLYLWPGVAFLVSTGLTGMLIHWKTVINAFSSLTKIGAVKDKRLDQIMEPKYAIGLMIIITIVHLIVMKYLFNIEYLVSFVTHVIGCVFFNLIANRGAGETGFNPIRVMGPLLQGVSALCGASASWANLTAAGVSSGAIGQTSIFVGDGAFGRWLKVPAHWQWLVQLAVLPIVAVVSAVTYHIVAQVYPVDQLAAPVAKMWAKTAEIFAGKALPPYALESIIIGGVAGILFGVLDTVVKNKLDSFDARYGQLCEEAEKVGGKPPEKKATFWEYMPNSFGLGIALIIPTGYSVSFFLGALILCIFVPKIFKTGEDTLNTIAAAGIIGEGATALFVAILQVLKFLK